MSGSTESRFVRSAGAATFSSLWRVGVTFLVELILRRLIPAADWGLWQWALAAFLVLSAARDLGLIFHVVRVRPRPFGNLLAVELGWGSLLTVATFAAAPLIARFYEQADPNKVAVLKALSLFLLLEGLAAVPKVYFESELAIGRTVLPEVARNLTFSLLAIGLALAGQGVWSFVIAHLAATAVYAGWLWLRAYKVMPLTWQRGRTLGLVVESLPLASIWLLSVLIVQIDMLILGPLVPGDRIGAYGFAYKTAFLVSFILVPAMTRSLYPALVAFRSNPRRALEAYRLATVFVLAAEAPMAMFLFANAELSIRILGGSGWAESPAFLRILCFAPLIEPLSRLGGEVLKTYRKDALWIAASLATLASFAVGGFLLTRRFGPYGMAWANYLPLGVVLMGFGLRRLDSRVFDTLLKELVLVYAAPALPLLAVYFLTPDALILRFALSIAALIATLLFYWRRFGASARAFLSDPVAATEAAEG